MYRRQTILSAFNEAGIVPFDCSKVISNKLFEYQKKYPLFSTSQKKVFKYGILTSNEVISEIENWRSSEIQQESSCSVTDKSDSDQSSDN